MAESEEQDNKRSYQRESVRTKARLGVDGEWHDCVITNISPVGVRLYLRMSVESGTAVHIQVAEFGQYDATVIWSYGDETGLRFEHDPAEMTNLIIALAS